MVQVLELTPKQEQLYGILSMFRIKSAAEKDGKPRITFYGGQQDFIKELRGIGVTPEYRRYGEGSTAAEVTIDSYEIRAKEQTGHNPNISFYAPDEKDPLYRALKKRLQPRKRGGADSTGVHLGILDIPFSSEISGLVLDGDPLERYRNLVEVNMRTESES